ncbi:hypothetical protein SAMN02745206_01115 [Desulfacinum infernum DSM 9756]|jgi:hypothetical protein|uniref:Uncharacterized protein n=1 Tax=Desulfacinum infernum DSM 9756 TaxID=1121391 RepID=A0A1M4XUM2_9BACT|nr:hypothetical protein [Desulfacinum infernum]MBC7358199.1 hypothetical protein [Desulfacinum sp.]MBZ4660389.1 winged helix-turn-helix transcriptional regulator [Desulfacinum sp.]SHE96942.1 hypothetical protein SAMN02745206_01115 [Desulfacinum infernum DSM 9756]
MLRCDACGATVNRDEQYEHAGQTLCEDCYLDRMATPKVCDPWAVYSAKKTGEGQGGLTELQEKILKLLKERGPVPLEEIEAELGIDESEFRANFATLRHLELAKATKVGDKVCYTLFS